MSAIPGPGELIAGKYQLQREIGRGGMGAVYAGMHRDTGRRFAIKLLNPQLAGDADAETRFFREAMLASAINHPAIVEVYDVGRHGDAPYMVMKLLEGESLGARIERGALTADEAIAIMLPVLDGVSAAHARGILHRDLKPDNILLAREDDGVRPKILDFGISKLLGPETEPRLTRTGISIGTPLYMSPEQVRGESSVDARADVYALGVILYEMVTGLVPYHGNNYADLVVKIVAGGAPSARSHNPTVHVALDTVIARAMARDVEHRYPSASALAADLRTYRSIRPVPPPVVVGLPAQRMSARPSTPLTTPAARVAPRRPPPAWVFALVSLIGALAFGASWLWNDRQVLPHAASRPMPIAPAPLAPVPPRALPARPAAITPTPEADAPTLAAPPARRTPRSRIERPARSEPKPAEPKQPQPKRWSIPNEIIDPFEDPG